MGIMPVCRIERRAIGQGRPGALTRRLSELYEEEIRRSV
jgi:branched-subunit amino acid aminotransferase/4-amino-4-deoxychorismate lyase